MNHEDAPKLSKIIKSGPNSVSANEFLDLPSNESLILESTQLELLKKGKSWTFSSIEASQREDILLADNQIQDSKVLQADSSTSENQNQANISQKQDSQKLGIAASHNNECDTESQNKTVMFSFAQLDLDSPLKSQRQSKIQEESKVQQLHEDWKENQKTQKEEDLAQLKEQFKKLKDEDYMAKQFEMERKSLIQA